MRLTNGKPTQVALLNGTFLAFEGQPLLSLSKKSSYATLSTGAQGIVINVASGPRIDITAGQFSEASPGNHLYVDGRLAEKGAVTGEGSIEIRDSIGRHVYEIR